MTGLLSLSPADIADVMRIERGPGYEAFVGRWTVEEHLAEIASESDRYLGWRHPDGGLAGFVIFQEFGDPTTPVLLRRIAVDAPGRGIGGALLIAALDWAFASAPFPAVELHVKTDNARAQRVYAREGFARIEGSMADHFTLSLSRETWLGRRSA